MAASVFAADIYEDGTPVLLARVTGVANAAITQATCSSIAYTITDTTSLTVVDSGSLTISAVVYDQLQTDAVWSRDALGYNFKWTPSAANFAAPGVTYATEVAFTMGTGEKIQVPFRLTTVPVVRS